MTTHQKNSKPNYFVTIYYTAFAWLAIHVLHMEEYIYEKPFITSIIYFIGMCITLEISKETKKQWKTRHLQEKEKIKELLHVYTNKQLDHLLDIEGIEELFFILKTGVIVSFFTISLLMIGVHRIPIHPILLVFLFFIIASLISSLIYIIFLSHRISVDDEKQSWLIRYMNGENKQYIREVKSIFEEYDDLAGKIINNQMDYFDALNIKDRRRENELQQSIYAEHERKLIDTYGKPLAELILSDKITESTALKVLNEELEVNVLKDALIHAIPAKQIDLIANGRFQVKDIVVASSLGLPPEVAKLYHNGEIDDAQFNIIKVYKDSRFISLLASEDINFDEFVLLCDEEIKIGFDIKLVLLILGEPFEEKTTTLKTKIKTEYIYLDENSPRRKVKFKLTFDDDILVKISN